MHASDGIVLLLCIMNLAPRRWIVAVILGLLAGCSDSPKNTFEGYKARAERGDPVAQYNLGVCYDNGEGVAKNQVEAVKWYRKAAEQGLAKAQFNLGNCYHNEKGVAKDQVEAVKWCRKAADQGLAEAQFNLGACYYNGEGVTKDEVEAYAYWNLVRITDEQARSNLAILEKKMSPEARLLGQRRTKELQKEIEAKIAAKKAGK